MPLAAIAATLRRCCCRFTLMLAAATPVTMPPRQLRCQLLRQRASAALFSRFAAADAAYAALCSAA